ncbi:Swt1 family HEPN domain-containing protein [Collimonas humicola]|uniref:Swt1 family HEPN domain-containing protein n=1 Tax=Collimonas humicola TaxID=2825886 RepID=UPI001B8B9D6E|nr:Swt1 family HEPN domain-containing protein [Collimonas humicola]
MSTSARDLRDWMFRGLMFEADAENFRRAGLRIGADQREVEQALFAEVLSPFGVDLRNDALMMSRIYALVYCFERSVRALINERLTERHGIAWWDAKVPQKIRNFAASRIKDSEENTWLEGQSKDPMEFIQFGQLSDIITENWVDFTDLIPSHHWLKQRMDELEKTRNFIAHNRLLLPGEFQRIEMYVNDWNRQVGL